MWFCRGCRAQGFLAAALDTHGGWQVSLQFKFTGRKAVRAAAIIPARWASSRFPGKPLAPLLGKPMIAWVVEAASMAARVEAVCVATDDERIAEAARAAGALVVMTSPDCASGTDRVAAAAKELPAEVYLNVQGDEPMIDPRDLDRLVAAFDGANPPRMATLARVLADPAEASNPNAVKVVRSALGDALYFSRSPIPYYRDCAAGEGGAPPTLLHVGVYAYTAGALFDFAAMGEAGLERAEKLEQLRALEAGWRIRVVDALGAPGVGVDRPEDLEKAENLLAAKFAGLRQG